MPLRDYRCRECGDVKEKLVTGEAQMTWMLPCECKADRITFHQLVAVSAPSLRASGVYSYGG